MKMKVMNVAVVGAGIYGINHVNAYTWNPNTNLVAVCDLNKEITDKIAKQYEVKTYNDVNEMLDKEEIDAVSFATPDAFHMEPGLSAMGNRSWWRSLWLRLQRTQKKFLRKLKSIRCVLRWITIRDGIRRRSM